VNTLAGANPASPRLSRLARLARLAAAPTSYTVVPCGRLGSSVVDVAAGSALRVDVGEWDELGPVVGAYLHDPLAAVDHPMMKTTLCRSLDYAA
jgi:hypothetical protein